MMKESMRYLGWHKVEVKRLYELGRAEPYHVIFVWAHVYQDEVTHVKWGLVDGKLIRLA